MGLFELGKQGRQVGPTDGDRGSDSCRVRAKQDHQSVLIRNLEVNSRDLHLLV
jgi:hypothetical protein